MISVINNGSELIEFVHKVETFKVQPDELLQIQLS